MNCLLKNFAGLAFLGFLTACGAVHKATSTPIGIQPLSNFTLRNENFPSDTVYKVFRSEEQFDAVFAPASPETKKPSFNGQTAFAILFKQASGNNPLRFEKVEISGSTMNVYAVTETPAAGTDGSSGKIRLAATAKSDNVKKVQFFINGESRNQVIL